MYKKEANRYTAVFNSRQHTPLHRHRTRWPQQMVVLLLKLFLFTVSLSPESQNSCHSMPVVVNTKLSNIQNTCCRSSKSRCTEDTIVVPYKMFLASNRHFGSHHRDAGRSMHLPLFFSSTLSLFFAFNLLPLTTAINRSLPTAAFGRVCTNPVLVVT